MNIVAKKNWVYRVYELNENQHVISIPFGSGAVDFSRAFKVTLESLDDEYLTRLCEDIKSDYSGYQRFEVDHP